MNLREGKFCKRLKDILENQCAWVFNVHGHGMQKAGVPDLHIIHRKWAGYLELKAEKNKPTGLQKKIGNQIRARNYPCFVFRSVDVRLDHQGNAISWNYFIEDFDGNVIATVANLTKTIDMLVELRGQEHWGDTM